jgi:hypothetical protein
MASDDSITTLPRYSVAELLSMFPDATISTATISSTAVASGEGGSSSIKLTGSASALSAGAVVQAEAEARAEAPGGGTALVETSLEGAAGGPDPDSVVEVAALAEAEAEAPEDGSAAAEAGVAGVIGGPDAEALVEASALAEAQTPDDGTAIAETRVEATGVPSEQEIVEDHGSDPTAMSFTRIEIAGDEDLLAGPEAEIAEPAEEQWIEDGAEIVPPAAAFDWAV